MWISDLNRLYPAGERGKLPVKVYPGLLPSANIRGAHGRATAIALWHLARAMDLPGEGRVLYDDLLAFALEIWSRDKFYRVIRAAKSLGLVKQMTRERDQARVISITGAPKVLALLNLSDLGAAPIIVSMSALRTAATFKATLFCTFHAGGRTRTPSKNPISRQTLQSLTHVGRRTQPRYEARNNARRDGQVSATPNYLLLGYRGEAGLAYARDNIHGAAFLYGDAVARQLPNTYHDNLRRVSACRLRKVNRQRHLILSGLVMRTDAGHGKMARRSLKRYFDSAKRADKAGRKDIDMPGVPTALQTSGPRVRYYRSGTTHHGSATVWQAVDSCKNGALNN